MERRGLPQFLQNNKRNHPLPIHYELLFFALSQMVSRGLASGVGDWSLLDNLALPEELERKELSYHRLAPLLESWRPQESLTNRRRQWLTQVAMLAGLREAICEKSLNDLGDAFSSRRIRALLVKGSGLAYSLYQKPFQRSRHDTDLWISPRDSKIVRELLLNAGFTITLSESVSGFSVLKGTTNQALQIFDVKFFAHWRPLFANTLSFDEAWEGSLPTKTSLRTTGHSATLLLTALNRVTDLSWKSRAMPFIQIVDSALLWKAMGDDAVLETLELADKRRVGEAVRYLLTLAVACRTQPVSSVLSASLWSTSRQDSTRIYFKEGFNDHAAFYLDLASISELRKKVGHLVPLAFPKVSDLWYWWNLSLWKKQNPLGARILSPFLSPVLYSINVFRILKILVRGFFVTRSLKEVEAASLPPIIETEFSKALAETTQKISELAEVRRLAAPLGFRLVIWGGSGRELIAFAMEKIKSLGSVGAYRQWLQSNTFHWLDWHRVDSDIDILAVPLTPSANFSDLPPLVNSTFKGTLFFSKIELWPIEKFLTDFPNSENHYDSLSYIPISERGVELLPDFESDLGINLAVWGLRQYEEREFDFRINKKVFRKRFPYREVIQILRWVRFVGENPQMHFGEASRSAILSLVSRLKKDHDEEVVRLFQNGEKEKTLESIVLKALRRVYDHSRNPVLTKKLLIAFGIEEWLTRAGASDKILFPLERHPGDERLRLGQEVETYLETTLAQAQNISWGALWLGSNGAGIKVSTERPAPQWGKCSLVIVLNENAALGRDLKLTENGYEIFTLNAIKRIEPVTHGSMRQEMINQFKFNHALKPKELRTLLQVLSLNPS